MAFALGRADFLLLQSVLSTWHFLLFSSLLVERWSELRFTFKQLSIRRLRCTLKRRRRAGLRGRRGIETAVQSKRASWHFSSRPWRSSPAWQGFDPNWKIQVPTASAAKAPLPTGQRNLRRLLRVGRNQSHAATCFDTSPPWAAEEVSTLLCLQTTAPSFGKHTHAGRQAVGQTGGLSGGD